MERGRKPAEILAALGVTRDQVTAAAGKYGRPVDDRKGDKAQRNEVYYGTLPDSKVDVI